MNAQERQRGRAEILRLPKTAMSAAFLRALRDYCQKHSSDDTAPVVLPVGIVTTAELSKVVTALIASKQNGRGRHPAAE